MSRTVTNYESYVNGYKVVSDEPGKVTLENGVTIEKDKCQYVSTDHAVGATYYHYEEE